MKTEIWNDQPVVNELNSELFNSSSIGGWSRRADDIILEICIYWTQKVSKITALNKNGAVITPCLLVTDDINLRVKGYSQHIHVMSIHKLLVVCNFEKMKR